MNFLPVQVKTPLLITHPQFRLTLPELWESNLRFYDGKTVTLGIRPEHLHTSPPAPKNLPLRVERVEALGSETYLSLRLVEQGSLVASSPLLQARIEPDRPVRVGEDLWFSMEADKLHLFDDQTGEAIATDRPPLPSPVPHA